ncbi:MAG: ATP-binding protein [Thermoplasmatota archaeon]
MAETNAKELQQLGLRPERASARLRRAVLDRLQSLRAKGLSRPDALEALLPGVVLEPETLEILVSGLLAGGHALILGPSGTGKTLLAKALWDLMPGEVFAVADCPVQDDPFSLTDPAFAKVVPACPFCKANHGSVGGMKGLGGFDPANLKAENIPVKRVRLREGHGFARVQGSAEVFPDNLTGSINLARLEQIGDPTSPLVLEPGKALQAHRGLLFVDEVGKLPRGTQNVLLQALQEGIVTPAKSRETFPADLVAITTTNVRDLALVTEPLSDRLAHVVVALPRTHRSNRRIVELGLSGEQAMPIPGPYREAAVELMMRWRAKGPGTDDLAEVASNRTLVEMLRRAGGYALLEGDRTIDPQDFRRGARDAMRGRVRGRSPEEFERNQRVVTDFVDQAWADAAKKGANAYWCRFFVGELKEDKAEGLRVLEAVRQAMAGDATQLAATVRQGGDPKVRRFAQFVQAEEGVDHAEVPERLPAVVHALDELGAFQA